MGNPKISYAPARYADPAPAAWQLYFAYGSNMWLRQMARRCPQSRYAGRAVLHDHAWQINSRGFANVTPRCGSNVHGLVFAVRPRDVERLDRNEGVGLRRYERAATRVLLYEAPPGLRLQTQSLADKAADLAAYSRRCHEAAPEAPPLARDALVYLSSFYVGSGTARDEYVGRMNRGIADAVALGVPSDFFDNAVRSWLTERPARAAAAAARDTLARTISSATAAGPRAQGYPGRSRAVSADGRGRSDGAVDQPSFLRPAAYEWGKPADGEDFEWERSAFTWGNDRMDLMTADAIAQGMPAGYDFDRILARLWS